MAGIRFLRGLGALLVGGLLLALLVPDNALAGMCHRWFPGASMTPAKYFAGAIIGIVPLLSGGRQRKQLEDSRAGRTFLFFAETRLRLAEFHGEVACNANRIRRLRNREETFGEGQMIEVNFDSKTLAKMNVALDRVCETAPRGEQHSVRKRIAREIIKCARSGKTTLSELTSAGERALHELPPQQGSGLGAAPEARPKYE